jgi:hypothetical protein
MNHLGSISGKYVRVKIAFYLFLKTTGVGYNTAG